MAVVSERKSCHQPGHSDKLLFFSIGAGLPAGVAGAERGRRGEADTGLGDQRTARAELLHRSLPERPGRALLLPIPIMYSLLVLITSPSCPCWSMHL